MRLVKIVRCEKNHYYDGSTYASCPYCNPGLFDMYVDRGAAYAETQATANFDLTDDEGVTVDYKEYTDNEQTVAADREGSFYKAGKAARNFAPAAGWLVCVEGPERGRDYRICGGRNYVGREVENDICIADDEKISRSRHFSVIYDARSHKFFAVPGESGAIQVNGEEIHKTYELRDGDVIGCGDSKLCFVSFCREGRDWT